jgi:hypothetical protein
MLIFFWRKEDRSEDRQCETADDDSERDEDIDVIVSWDKHFGTNESEDSWETVFEIDKISHHTCESEVERTETENSKNITRIDDKHIVRDSEYSRDGVEREDQISKLYHEECYEHRRRCEFCIVLCEKFSSIHLFWDRHDFFEYSYDELPLKLDFFFTLKEHLDSCYDEETTEDIDDKVKCFEDMDTKCDHDSTHHEGSEYSPEEDFVLIDFSDFEIREYQYKDKQIIDTERFFHHVGGHKLQGFFTSKPVPHESSKYSRKANPHSTPDECFFCFYLMCFFIEYAQIDDKHDGDEEEKSLPEICLDVHKKKLDNSYILWVCGDFQWIFKSQIIYAKYNANKLFK